MVLTEPALQPRPAAFAQRPEEKIAAERGMTDDGVSTHTSREQRRVEEKIGKLLLEWEAFDAKFPNMYANMLLFFG